MTTRAPFRITVCGIEELPGHCEAGVSHVLSILDPDWPVPAAFGRFGTHERLELRFHDVIEDISDMRPPGREHVARLLAFGRDLMAWPVSASEAHLLVHCHAGVSRSTASMALILAQARPGRPAQAVVEEVRRIRPQAWPNLRIIELGDALLGRNGQIIAAVGELYGRQLQARPEMAEPMIQAGRQREIMTARTALVHEGPMAPDE